jgi:hypothetical protein
MNGTNGKSYGSRFERAFVGLLALMSGAVLIYLAILGPLVLGLIIISFSTEPAE